MSRRRFVYRPHPDTGEITAFEVGSDWTDVPRSTGDMGKFEYSNVRATDGTDISSRTKYKDYLKANGYAPASDFTETWAKNRERAATGYEPPEERKERRETIGRVMYEKLRGR